LEDTFLRTMLFDFYGDLLTDKQREYYDLHYMSDLSLFEIAEMNGTSRQAVWDIIRRAEQTLREIEAKTGLVARAMQRRAAVAEIAALTGTLPDSETKRGIIRRLEQLEE
jgi:predicted DNA-binding protein YlxM (UPF0122 family)